MGRDLLCGSLDWGQTKTRCFRSEGRTCLLWGRRCSEDLFLNSHQPSLLLSRKRYIGVQVDGQTKSTAWRDPDVYTKSDLNLSLSTPPCHTEGTRLNQEPVGCHAGVSLPCTSEQINSQHTTFLHSNSIYTCNPRGRSSNQYTDPNLGCLSRFPGNDHRRKSYEWPGFSILVLRVESDKLIVISQSLAPSR